MRPSLARSPLSSCLSLSLVACLVSACGDSGNGTTAGASTTGGDTTTDPGTSTTDPGTSTAPTTTSGVSATDSGTTTGEPVTTTSPATTDEPMTTTGTTGPDTTSGSSTTTTTDSSTGNDTEAVCVPDDVPDTLVFNYVQTIDIGITGIQASWYNIQDQEMVFVSYMGPGKRVALDGTVLGDVAAPPALVIVDGGTYDQVNNIGLLVDQGCQFAEVDAVTLAQLSLTQLDAKFGLSTCSGLAIGLDGHLYITSTDTDEVVVITRDLTTEIRRFKVDDDGLSNVDGISLIAGSENFLVLSTFDLKAAIFDPDGNVVVPSSLIGTAAPLNGGDEPAIPDASLTVCGNGHAWVCEGLQKVGCYEYAPEGGDSDSCPCVLPQ